MNTHHDPRTTGTLPTDSHPSNSSSRWLTLVMTIGGALAGASIVETLAALITQSQAPITSNVAIALLLAVFGAVGGGILAAILARSDGHPGESNTLPMFDITPIEPMAWTPSPRLLPREEGDATTTVAHLPRRQQATRIRHALRHHRNTRSRQASFPRTHYRKAVTHSRIRLRHLES